ncbi:MAG: S-methyl-5'-thioadenosine phosphorylase [Bacteroidales bacterium]|nr:S-methyl-5'-thioadenosine phosphorylase [Bacteroidales bacterium]
MKKIGIIGGTGLEKPEILQNPQIIRQATPFGRTSSELKSGQINGTEVVLLSRHGEEHTIPPSKVNNQANIFALKKVGCTHIIATTACGSLRENIDRGDLVFPDQFIDFTRQRPVTFYERFNPGELKHTPMADPFDQGLRTLLIQKAKEMGLSFHPSGTVITIEGPRFSTRAESRLFRMWGADIINMSLAPEVILANEARIPYAAIAMSTDFDVWKENAEPFTCGEILEIFSRNVHNVTGLIQAILPEIR